MSYQPPPPPSQEPTQPIQQPPQYSPPQHPPQINVTRRKRSPLPFILGGVGALLGLCVLCVVAAAVTGTLAGRGTPTPVTSAQSVPTVPTPDESGIGAAPQQPPAGGSAGGEYQIGEVYLEKWINGPGVLAMGVITYTGSEPRYSPEILITLTDESGKVLASGKAGNFPDYIKPNSVIPYGGFLPDAPEKWARSEVSITADSAGSFRSSLIYAEYEVEQPSLVPPKNEYEGVRVIGRIRNVGKKVATSVEVTAALYDANGKLLDVISTYPMKWEIAPGEDSTFEITGAPKASDRFVLYVDGWVREP